MLNSRVALSVGQKECSPTGGDLEINYGKFHLFTRPTKIEKRRKLLLVIFLYCYTSHQPLIVNELMTDGRTDATLG